MTIHVSIKEAKNKLSELIRSIQDGERVVLTRNGNPVADLVPHQEKKGLNFEALQEWKKRRGVDRIVTYIADDFDDPLTEDLLITPGPY